MNQGQSVPTLKIVLKSPSNQVNQQIDTKYHQYVAISQPQAQPVFKVTPGTSLQTNIGNCAPLTLLHPRISLPVQSSQPIQSLSSQVNSTIKINLPSQVGQTNQPVINPSISENVHSEPLGHPPGCCCERHIRTQPVNMIVNGESRIGANFTYSRYLSSSLMQSLPSQCKCAQFFMTSRFDCYSTKPLDYNDKATTLDYCDKHGKTFYNHINYACNFARTRFDGDKGMKAFYHIKQQIENMKGLPAACILHTGKVGKNGEHGSIENAMDNINALDLRLNTHARMPYSLLLEVSAGQGDGFNGGRSEIGHTWEQIRWMYEAVDRSTVGLCLDTQHLFASGMCNFGYEETVRLLDTVRDYCKAGVPVIHLNDSKTPFGSRVDRHERLCFGHIWGRRENYENLFYLVQRCKEDGIDLILETPEETGVDDLRLLGLSIKREQPF